MAFSQVIFNSFEQALSSDVNRLQQLANRDIQNLLRSEGKSDEIHDATTGSAVGPTSVLSGGDPISGCSDLPYLTPTAGFTMQLGPGQAFLNDDSITGDNSPFQVVRWAAQTLTFGGAPAGGTWRVDLVSAPATVVATDPISRNVLVDPQTRTVAMQTLNKTSNPLATAVVTAGAAGTSPSAPSTPAGHIALFEVIVIDTAASSNDFLVMRRAWKRAEYPLSTYHGILQGCVPSWSATDETSSALITLPAIPHRCVIDGEIIVFNQALTLLQSVNDAINPPLAGAAGTDRPFYIYLYGGRRVGAKTYLAANLSTPLIMIHSATAPDAYGHPSAAIQPSGAGSYPSTRAGALYIGIGFTANGGTNKKSCQIVDDNVYSVSGQNIAGQGVSSMFSEPARAVLSGSAIDVALATRPSVSTLAKVRVLSNEPTGVSIQVRMKSAALANPVVSSSAINGSYSTTFELPLSLLSAPEMTIGATGGSPTDINLGAYAYNMKVPRLSP